MKQIIFFLAFTGITLMVAGQHHEYCENEEKREKIKAEKIAYITNKLDLSVEEAQKFWPLYNEMEEKHQEIKDQFRTNKRNLKKNLEDLTDKEVEDAIDKIMELIVKEAEIEKEYYQKFKKVLPIRKVFKLQQAEKEFTRELLRKLKGHHHGLGPGPRPFDHLMH